MSFSFLRGPFPPESTTPGGLSVFFFWCEGVCMSSIGLWFHKFWDGPVAPKARQRLGSNPMPQIRLHGDLINPPRDLINPPQVPTCFWGQCAICPAVGCLKEATQQNRRETLACLLVGSLQGRQPGKRHVLNTRPHPTRTKWSRWNPENPHVERHLHLLRRPPLRK